MIGAKGLDDLLKAGGRPRIRRRCFPPASLGQRTIPYGTVQLGETIHGDGLDTARAKTERAINHVVRDRRQLGGRALLVATPAGVGKSTAIATAVKAWGASARILVGTKTLAREQASAYGYHLIEGRSPDNCVRFDVVEALGSAGFPVEAFACGSPDKPRCPLRAACTYYQQFNALGPWVGSAEQLFNRNFLAFGDLIVVDDADLLRTLIARHVVEAGQLERAQSQLVELELDPAAVLVSVIRHTIIDTTTALIGPAVWDALVGTAHRLGLDFPSVVRELPPLGLLAKPLGASGEASVETVAAVPPAHLTYIFEALQRELAAFELGEDFNSWLRISPSGVEARMLRKHTADDDKALVARVPMLVLDATPVDVAIDHLTSEHRRLPDVRCDVSLPSSVSVVQYAGRSNGHTVLRQQRSLDEVCDEIRRERQRHPVRDSALEAVICFKEHRPAMLELGFAPAQVLSFGSVRGSNSLAGVERLHVVGRPMPPSDELVYAAQVLHHGEVAISPEVVVVSRPYGGQRLAVDVVDFADERASRLLHSHREDELLQVIHRARLHLLESQLGLLASSTRNAVRLVLHTSHPIPRLPVNEVIYEPVSASDDLNNARAADAAGRIRLAYDELRTASREPSIDAIARRAHSSWRTVAQVLRNSLHTPEDETSVLAGADDGFGAGNGTALHTPKDEPTLYVRVDDGEGAERERNGKGLHTPEKISIKGVQSVPKHNNHEGAPCGCGGCRACASGLELHHIARLKGAYWTALGICRWCQLSGGVGA